jgi:ribonuclease HII
MDSYIIGADEVGYGAWAGPLVVCGVRAKDTWLIPGLNDSKKLSRKKRENMSALLLANTEIQYEIVSKSNTEIDNFGLGVCLKQAYQEVADKLLTLADRMVIDGTVKLPKRDPRVSCLIKADQKVSTVMAASIIAKVYRDNLMYKLAAQYPMYDWENNVGYGGAQNHRDGIKKHGFCELHRHSYKIKI